MSQTPARRPLLPRPFSLPLSLIPDRAHSLVMSKVLNHVFEQEIVEGELDFLEDKVVRIQVTDAGLSYGLRFADSALHAETDTPADLTISGTVYDYLLLITDREDADTLFFQRHLSMQGSTALGVHLKNFLAGIDIGALPLPDFIRPALERAVRLYERIG